MQAAKDLEGEAVVGEGDELSRSGAERCKQPGEERHQAQQQKGSPYLSHAYW